MNINEIIQAMECEIDNIESAKVMLDNFQYNFDVMGKDKMDYYIAGVQSLLKFCKKNLENYIRQSYESLDIL